MVVEDGGPLVGQASLVTSAPVTSTSAPLEDQRDRTGRSTTSTIGAPPYVPVLLVLAACLPFIAIVIARTATHWTPTQDLAVIDLRVRDVWSGDIPLEGAYSRFGWSHPGPIMFYVLAVPSLLFGQAAWATLVGGALFQAIAVVWLGRVSWKTGGIALCFAFMMITTLSYASTGAWIVTEVWNPHLAFPWFILFVFYAWRLALGETERLPGAVVASSVVAQLHVGYVYLLVAAVAAISVSYWIDRRAGRRWSWSRRSIVISLGVLAVLWLPVVLDAVLHPPGNLYEVVDFLAFGGADGARNGLRSGLGLLGHEFTWPPQWITGQRGVRRRDRGCRVTRLRTRAGRVARRRLRRDAPQQPTRRRAAAGGADCARAVRDRRTGSRPR